MGAVYGGRLPHTPAFIAGGFTAISSEADKTRFGALLAELTAWIRGTYLPDVELLASLYSDYFAVGRGPANLLSFGVFEQDTAGTTKLLAPGRVAAGSAAVQPVDPAAIAEAVTCSWYADSTDGLSPAAGETSAQYPKPGAYSWLKAPRHGGSVYEVGPLARMTVNGDYRRGVSTMDRHLARAHECLKIAVACAEWLENLEVGATAYEFSPAPESAIAEGLTEAPRGALGHWLTVAGGAIQHYQVVTPTCWNCSPRDQAGVPGAMEQALVGTPVARVDQPIEVLRVIHSFDPCLDCATHVMRPGGTAIVVPVWRPPPPVPPRAGGTSA
jgi:hydrogenase large subunit